MRVLAPCVISPRTVFATSARPTATTSRPECSKNRWSSAARTAAGRNGDISPSATGRRRSSPVSATPVSSSGSSAASDTSAPSVAPVTSTIHGPRTLSRTSFPGSELSGRRWISQRPPVRRNSPGRAGAAVTSRYWSRSRLSDTVRMETPGRSVRLPAKTSAVPWAASRSSRAAVRLAQIPTPPAAAVAAASATTTLTRAHPARAATPCVPRRGSARAHAARPWSALARAPGIGEVSPTSAPTPRRRARGDDHDHRNAEVIKDSSSQRHVSFPRTHRRA